VRIVRDKQLAREANPPVKSKHPRSFALSHDEAVALRLAVTHHDMDLATGQCECGQRLSVLDTDDRCEHLLEVAFAAGKRFERRRGLWSGSAYS